MSYNLKKATLTWEGHDLAFAATGGSGHTIHFGNPAGPNGGSPMEAIVMASGGCTASDVIDILRKKRQDVTGFEVNVAGSRTAEPPMLYTEIDLEYVVRGRHIDPTAVARAIELSLTKYCSVNIMLEKGGVKINSRYRIEEEAAEAAVA
ncbi:MAG: OsmC family protein [Chloroflexi bacterium]|nr:OsmC family protein [Chloroflexota bacterium]